MNRSAHVARTPLVAVLAAAVLTCGPGRDASAAAAFRVIVHPDVKGSQMPRSVLSAIFLKQALKWGDGRSVVPVDQSVQSAVRRAFSVDVLKQGIVEVQVYWQRQIGRGLEEFGQVERRLRVVPGRHFRDRVRERWIRSRCRAFG